MGFEKYVYTEELRLSGICVTESLAYPTSKSPNILHTT